MGKVFDSMVLVKTEANAYSFQESKKEKIAAAPIPGPARGNSTFQKAWNLVQPSVLATSDISFGICLTFGGVKG